MNFKVIFLSIQKILYFFIIYLTHWNFDWEFDIFTWTFNPIENSSYHSGNYALIFDISDVRPHHCECFSWWSLPVCKNCSVESFKNRINYWSSCNIINFNLFWFHVKNWVKRKFILSKITWLLIWQINSYIFFILVKIKAGLSPFI